MSGHTPGPWVVNGFGGDFVVIARMEPHGVAISARAQAPGPGGPIADARFIVRACNSHEELLEALRGLAKAIYAVRGEIRDDYPAVSEGFVIALAAIAKAECR